MLAAAHGHVSKAVPPRKMQKRDQVCASFDTSEIALRLGASLLDDVHNCAGHLQGTTGCPLCLQGAKTAQESSAVNMRGWDVPELPAEQLAALTAAAEHANTHTRVGSFNECVDSANAAAGAAASSKEDLSNISHTAADLSVIAAHSEAAAALHASVHPSGGHLASQAAGSAAFRKSEDAAEDVGTARATNKRKHERLVQPRAAKDIYAAHHRDQVCHSGSRSLTISHGNITISQPDQWCVTLLTIILSNRCLQSHNHL